MRLTDTDALMESFEHALGAAPCELNGYEIWEILNAQERIEAIPVEWLLKKKASCVRMSSRASQTAWLIGELIKEWRKEQEENNESKV